MNLDKEAELHLIDIMVNMVVKPEFRKLNEKCLAYQVKWINQSSIPTNQIRIFKRRRMTKKNHYIQVEPLLSNGLQMNINVEIYELFEDSIKWLSDEANQVLRVKLKQGYDMVESMLLSKLKSICDMWSHVECGLVSSCDVNVGNKKIIIRNQVVCLLDTGGIDYFAEVIVEEGDETLFALDVDDDPTICVDYLYKVIHQDYFGFHMECDVPNPIRFTPWFVKLEKLLSFPLDVIEIILDYKS